MQKSKAQNRDKRRFLLRTFRHFGRVNQDLLEASLWVLSRRVLCLCTGASAHKIDCKQLQTISISVLSFLLIKAMYVLTHKSPTLNAKEAEGRLRDLHVEARCRTISAPPLSRYRGLSMWTSQSQSAMTQKRLKTLCFLSFFVFIRGNPQFLSKGY